MVQDFFTRLKTRLISLAPILLGAIILAWLMGALAFVVTPFLPQSTLDFIATISHDHWETRRATLKNLFLSYGIWTETVFLGVQLLQVLAAPIPGQLAGLVGGYVFGYWRGLALTMLGVTLGSFIAMSLSRLFGKKVARRFVPAKVTEKFDYLVEKEGLMNFFMIFLLPLLPDDAVCFIAGLTRLSLWRLTLVCFAGRLPGMAVLTYAGASVDAATWTAEIILGAAMISAFFAWIYEDEVKEFFHRLSGK